MKPTVGRIVHTGNAKGKTCAAIITKVYDEKRVNVTRFNPDGSILSVGSVLKVEHEPKTSGEWNWPPREG